MTVAVHQLDNLQKVDQTAYQQAVQTTLNSIQGAVSVQELTLYSNRPPAEVEALQKEVASIVPAGNVVALITSSLAGLRGRKLPKEQAQSDINALLRGVEVLPKTLFGTLFVPTAAVLAAYQKILTLTGTDQASAFPNGLWQFYLEFAMREDSAHHTNETVGFQAELAEYELQLSSADQLAAWVCAVSQLYFQYDNFLTCEWHEQVSLSILNDIVNDAGLEDKTRFKRLARTWSVRRPYGIGDDFLPDENYSLYRRRRFDTFLRGLLKTLPSEQRENFHQRYVEQEAAELTAYQEQMTILATLQPERYRETRQPVSLWHAAVGVIVNGHYYLIPACMMNEIGQPLLFTSNHVEAEFYALHVDDDGHLRDRNGQRLTVRRNGGVCDLNGDLRGYLRPIHFETVRHYTTTILDQSYVANHDDLADQLRVLSRPEQPRARDQLSQTGMEAITMLKTAPILINWDEQQADQPLAYLRRAKRGLNDHAVTIFRTERSMVFDESHIFFDGVMGLAFAEILTNEAINWGLYFDELPPAARFDGTIEPLRLPYQPLLAEMSPHPHDEVSAESTAIDLPALKQLRELLPSQHFEANEEPTVNDFLVLYRCKFGLDYSPSAEVSATLQTLQEQKNSQTEEAYQLIMEAIAALQDENPSILIPLNAAAIKPRERLYPTTFRNPFSEMWAIFEQTQQAMTIYQQDPTPATWSTFAERRGALLTRISYFSKVLKAHKRVALQGASTSSATMKLLAHVPDNIRYLLDAIPQRVDILNEILKGEEVISNVGRVARGTSLTRFISAKDDNENKTLVWGLLTDDNEILHLSLRDFRPHVAALNRLHRLDMAQLVASDQVNAFAEGFNRFVVNLTEIIQARTTRL